MPWSHLFPFTSTMVTKENKGLLLFILSSLLLSAKQTSAFSSLVSNCRGALRPLLLSPETDNEALTTAYVSLLKKLFQPVKSPSRHLGTTEIFKLRQRFFFDLFQEMKLDQTCSVIHVAGTKGKGSTCEYLAASLTAAGYRVGVFTSPHLHTARERIKIGRQLISMKDLVRDGSEALARMESQSWAVFFDYFLATALLYFGRQSRSQKLDYIVLECGIGGRYDSTNFFPDDVDPRRHTCAITSISYDHQAILGETLPEIAWQKAGIMRRGCNVFVTDQQEPEVLQVFREEAEKVGSQLVVVPVNRDSLAGKGIAYDHRAQLQNCMLADAVLSQWRVSAKQGVSSFYWPCRMETFRFKTSSPSSSAADLSSAGSSKAHEQLIVLDGCHNGDSIQVFLQSLAEKYPEHQKLIVFGAGMEKSIDMMIRALFLHSDKVVFVQSQHFKSYTEAQLLSKVPAAMEAGAGDSFHRKIVYLPTLESTLRGTVALRLLHCIRSLRSPASSGPLPASTSSSSVASSSASLQSNRPTVIGVCGSLFVAADAREALFRLDPSLFAEHDWVRESDPPIF